MATRQDKRSRLNEYLARTRPERITLQHWRELRDLLEPVSESYLRRLLRGSGVPLDPVVEGARQDCFAELERTLLALGEAYATASAAGDRSRASMCRRAVLTAKGHARLAARRLKEPERRVEKEEMISWMIVWLENPAVFSIWLRLRKRVATLSG